MTPFSHSPRARVGGVLGTFLSLCLVWWVLAEGHVDAWLIGVPAVVVATVVLARTGPALTRWPRLVALPGFVVYFAWQSLRGGIDVARRAMTPGLDLQPTVVDHKWSLPPGNPRTLAAIALNLMPGTLTVRDHGAHLSVHVLDGRVPVSIGDLERQVAALLGVEPRPAEREP